ALPQPDYVPGPEEPKQAPPSTVYIPYVPELVYPEYIPPKDDVFPAEEQPLPVAATPTTDSPGYIPESDPDEDPEEDPADYLADHDDEEGEEEPSGDDADEEDEEQDEDDDEEEEHPASTDSIPPPPALRLLSFDRRADRPEVALPPRKRLNIVHCPGYEAREIHFKLQGYMTYTWVQDQRIDVQDTLIATLTTHLSSLHGHLVTALGDIRALQAREQARAGAPEGAGSST
nr:hypothetical protein [Tanacetum cinerariifolium]